MNRRSALKGLGLTAGLVAAGNALDFSAWAQASAPPPPTSPFTLPPLNYAYDALEPYIDATTMHLHHDKHHAAYVDKLNLAVAGHPDLAAKTVDDLIAGLSSVPEDLRTAIRNQGGGHANHSFWWLTLSGNGGAAPKAELAKDIDAAFSSFAKFQEQLSKAAATVFGTGWAWLTLSHEGKLQIETSANQESPLSSGRTPLLALDVWEHAYYLKYNNRRPDYLAAWWNTVNWDEINKRFATAQGK